jgi:4'-phosphopantetheinyl transferase
MSDVVQLWKVSLTVPDDTLAGYFACLSDLEKDRAGRFKFAQDRRRFVVARGTLRHLLGAQFACSPEAVDFCYGEYGKPGLKPFTQGYEAGDGNHADDCPTNFQFNLSHSGDLALCALGHHHAVGVDVEMIKPMQRLENMIERCLSEREQVKAKTTSDPLRAFLQRWTCKEAYLKAIGKGLSQSMKTVEVDLTASQLLSVPDECEEGWYLHRINLSAVDLPETYVGALVVAGEVPVEIDDWRHDRV